SPRGDRPLRIWDEISEKAGETLARSYNARNIETYSGGISHGLGTSCSGGHCNPRVFHHGHRQDVPARPNKLGYRLHRPYLVRWDRSLDCIYLRLGKSEGMEYPEPYDRLVRAVGTWDSTGCRCSHTNPGLERWKLRPGTAARISYPRFAAGDFFCLLLLVL